MKYFTINELIKTSTGISNIPNAEHVANMIYLVENLLDKAREENETPYYFKEAYLPVSITMEDCLSKYSEVLDSEIVIPN